MMKRFLLWILAVLSVGACTTVPPTNVHQPMTARPVPRQENLASTGSIFQAGVSRTLFEDRRARYVGDTMTISISETTSASTKSNTKASRNTSISATAPTIRGLPGKSFQGIGLSAEGANSLDGKGEAAANNVFTGTITVTVIEVLPNGNLLVSGEKQVSIGAGTEYIRLSGIVNPYFINAANTISSSQVADARIEYKESGVISEAQVMGWLARFFLSFLPF
ncbi:MAG: flagellar basal body L-ring protein FlgH [Propionivibrio sp.]|uniref:flagellar basal body L-ring protein FlgH n=2 Tax=Propionivibrio sp. TaxID=2212460 RepID=UPI003457D608|nr:flagellar basal body L-ring protein FlgH [Propionivibrio sp.]MBK8400795.1 flagellar basal body L-ring protein FlgH [Propionivibrio sp.]MBK8744821.1 flagellar basal body L-ring protein FlgH [Propionivibrio sp.]MBK8893199.1 flagellar basal body L-ring protein FlgH [Propionivibrio sp.]MBL0207825.1 flagellar basal body L-ring protein FlgH [Propionivibrio sp.]